MQGEAVHDAQRLKELQALPLYRKIMITQTRIMEWYFHYGGKVYVSFSGGKDSTVLLHIARKIFPDIKAAFVNTGFEYPEVRKFALSFDRVEELRPYWGKAAHKYGKYPNDVVTFVDVVTYYGYPIISKAVSNAIDESRKPYGSRWKGLHGEYTRRDGGQSQFNCRKYLPLYLLPVRISDICCKVMKKGPAYIYQCKTGSHPIVATMASESMMRKQAWIKSGCNAFDAKEPVSKPMSFWTEQDVLHYIKWFRLQIASVYGDVVYKDTNGFPYDGQLGTTDPLSCTGCQRTGCIFCAYGCHLEKGETRFQKLSKTHPKQYDFCIGGGQYVENPGYDPKKNGPEIWNPPKIWVPSKQGLGMGKVFDMVNEIYGKDFIQYQ